MSVVAIVQARMGSTRLPGKVMKKMKGRPVLFHFIRRMHESKKIDKIVIATPDKAESQPILDLAKEMDVEIFKGSESDVLDRFYQAAKKHKADIIVRVTSDCPLLDPMVVDRVIGKFLEGGHDYVSNNLEKSFPHGLDTEVFSFKALEKAWKETADEYDREHVTPYFYRNPDKFKLSNVSNSEDQSRYRWTLDTKEDFAFISEVYKRMYREGEIFYTEDILNLLSENPHLLKMCTQQEK